MSAWGNGYVTDIEYSEGFYPDQCPAHLELTAILNGVEAPCLDGPYTYCELGCGRGKTSLVLAALNPQAEFHAIDFHPAHIAHARQQARDAALENLTFHELSFDELSGARGAPLPMFDVVTMHGVWSWIAPELQRAILAFLNVRLKPGGLVYVSYNAMPAWNQVGPVQRLIKELAAAAPERSDRAAIRAIEQLERLAAAKIIPPRFEDAIRRVEDSRQATLSYVAHEYLNEHWRPLYFADVARGFAAAKLEFAGCTDLLKNFYNLALNENQRALIGEMPSFELRETLKDFCTEHWFRQDLFVRGLRRMSESRREKLLGDATLAILRPAPEIFEIARADGSRWRPDVAVYQAISRALAQRPRKVSELLHLDGLPQDHKVGAVELVGTLVGTGLAGLYRKPSAAEISRARRLNELVHRDAEQPITRGATIALPTTRTGMTLSPGNYVLYRCLIEGESPDAAVLAARFIEGCRLAGGHPIIEGKPLENADEAQLAVTKDYATKIEQLVPIWRLIGLIG